MTLQSCHVCSWLLKIVPWHNGAQKAVLSSFKHFCIIEQNFIFLYSLFKNGNFHFIIKCIISICMTSNICSNKLNVLLKRSGLCQVQWPYWSCTCRSMFADMRELFIWSKLSIAARLVLTSDSRCRLWELVTWNKHSQHIVLPLWNVKAGFLLFFNWEALCVQYKQGDILRYESLVMSHFYSPLIPETIFALTVASLRTGHTSALWLFPKSHVPMAKKESVF